MIAIIQPLGILSNHFVNSMLPAHWLEFELGILVYLIIQRQVPRKFTIPVFIGLSFCGLVGSYRTQTAVIFSCMIFLLYKFDSSILRIKIGYPVRFLGKISYSLYLTHLLTLAVFDLIFKQFSYNSLLYYFCGIFAAILKQGLLWFDNDPKRTLEEKIAMAAERYFQKFGQHANTCYVNPGMFPEKGGLQANGVRVVAASFVLLHHLWVGVNPPEGSDF